LGRHRHSLGDVATAASTLRMQGGRSDWVSAVPLEAFDSSLEAFGLPAHEGLEQARGHGARVGPHVLGRSRQTGAVAGIHPAIIRDLQ
jgi:hypothetical protein